MSPATNSQLQTPSGSGLKRLETAFSTFARPPHSKCDNFWSMHRMSCGTMLRWEIKIFFLKIFSIFFVSPPFFVGPQAAVGYFGCWHTGVHFVAHTATLEVKLSSRTLEDIIEEQLVRISSSYFMPQFFFFFESLFKPGNAHSERF